MFVYKCDKCKKTLGEDKGKAEMITAQIGHGKQVELCSKCGSAIVAFLKKSKLIEVAGK